MCMPTMAVPSINELQTLLPSPTYASRRPLSRPLLSWIVKRSATTGHGCSLSSRPLMTETVAFAASSRTLSRRNDRYMMPSTYRLSTRAVSAIVSPRPIWRSFGLRNSAWPPSCVMPTSKETRVRVDAFSNSMARLLPRKGSYGSPAFVRFLILPASSRRPIRSSRTSSIEMRSRFPTIAADHPPRDTKWLCIDCVDTCLGGDADRGFLGLPSAWRGWVKHLGDAGPKPYIPRDSSPSCGRDGLAWLC